MKFRFSLFSFFLVIFATSVGISLGYIKGYLAMPVGGHPLSVALSATTNDFLISFSTSFPTSFPTSFSTSFPTSFSTSFPTSFPTSISSYY